MTEAPRPNPGIEAITPYVGGKSADAPDGRPVYKLSSNESACGPSPAALKAYAQAGADLSLYPDGAAMQLRQAIADRYGLAVERIVCGAGSDEILSLLGHAYLKPGDEALFSAHGFLMYRLITMACGATPVAVPETDLRCDVDAMLGAVTMRTRVVFVANPNNPTGTYLPIDEVRRLRAGLAPGVLLVIDAAYAEYVSANDYEPGIELVGENDNTVMTRTFSKIHGLAGLRVGWAFCPEAIAQVLNRVRGPFNVTAPALAAATASIGDLAHVELARAHNDTWRPWLEAELAKLGLSCTPSVGNFVLVHFADAPGHTATDAENYLAAHGIYVRGLAAYGLAQALRITVGSEAAMRAVVSTLKAFVEGKAGA
ncbi:MAG: histidinol-phosphate transaminase [Hyphomicrobiales bacterium]